MAVLMDVDWEAIACLLADSITKPTFVLDRTGRIRMANGAAERATGWRRQDVVGSHWPTVFTPARTGGGGGRWVLDALRGMVKEASFRGTSGEGVPLAIDVEISPVGDGESKALLLVADRVALADAEVEPAANIHYRIATRQEEFGALEYLATETQTTYLNYRHGRCFRDIYGLDSPCPDCPVLRGSEAPWPRHAVRAHATRDDTYEVVHATIDDDEAVNVHVRRISNDELSSLFSAKLRRLADTASLTARELAVLEHLMVGRGPEEIAILLEVSKRTVKFHQTNILHKLGAESRNDILRLLM